MLEFYDDYEEALNVLNDYTYDSSFPPNPNAHVYMYQFLKRHNAPEKKLMKALKVWKIIFMLLLLLNHVLNIFIFYFAVEPSFTSAKPWTDVRLQLPSASVR